MSTNAENALYHTRKTLYNWYRILITKEQWTDGNRKCAIGNSNGYIFYVLFKREPFKSYGAIVGTNDGAGESINKTDIEYCINRGIKQLLYVYPNNAIYKIRIEDVQRVGKPYKNESDHREQLIFALSNLQRLA